MVKGVSSVVTALVFAEEFAAASWPAVTSAAEIAVIGPRRQIQPREIASLPHLEQHRRDDVAERMFHVKRSRRDGAEWFHER